MISKIQIGRFAKLLVVFVFTGLHLISGLAGATGLSAEQKKVLQLGANYYNVDACGTGGDTSRTSASTAYMLGDSITERAQGEIKKAMSQNGISVSVDASTGRGLDKKGSTGNNLSGIDAIKEDSDDIKQADAIIIALGTNGGTDKDNIKKATEAIRDINNRAPMYWVDTFVLDREGYNRDVIAPANKAIYGSSGDQNYKVLSWFNTVDPDDDAQKPSGKEIDPNDYIDNSDRLGVHPTSAGSRAFAELVADAVSAAGTSQDDTGGQALCCGDSSTDDTGDTSLTGSDRAEKTWNYFTGRRGLSDEQAAGIMGNIQQESHFDPQIMEIGGRSRSPADAGDKGWGIIQWSGNLGNGHSTADKFNSLYNQSGLTGKKYDLATQLDLVWAHMQNKPPITRGDFSMDDFKRIKDEKEAAMYFRFHIEGGTDPGGVRENNATDLLHQYAGKSGGGGGNPDEAGASESNCGSDSASSPECGSATGNARILCEAKKYDPVSYVWAGGHAGGAAYHRACKDIDSSHSCGLDCSGLVTVAIYDVYGGSGSWDTNSLRADKHNWKEVSFEEAEAGDVIEPNPGHVEIVDHITGNTVYTFGAHTASVDQPKQVGPSQFKKADGHRFFRYIGAGT